MKPSFLILLQMLCLSSLLCPYARSTTNDIDADIVAGNLKPYAETFSYKAYSPVCIQAEGLALTADSGSLKYDLSISLTPIPYKSGYVMPSDMENVSLLNDGVRLLPGGEHFADTAPAVISLAYDPARIPEGYKQTDVFTFYCDGTHGWHRLERMAIDTITHTVTSLTTHFTDFANAVIKVPDMPESKAFVPTAMADIPDVNPMQGIPMIDAPAVNNRGTAELTYPIDLPKGRHGMQPDMDLHYSSAGGNGVLGVGWRIAFPAITIDTRWGVPRYDPLNESEQYMVNGEAVLFREQDGTAQTLPYQENSFIPRQKGNIRFYARDTKNWDRILRIGTGPMNYRWVVTDRNGITTYYGTDPDNLSHIDESSVVRTENNCIAYWAATMSVDVYGNYIRYHNIKVGNNIYVRSVDYTGNRNQNVPPLYNIKINYTDRSDVATNGRLGVLQEEQKLLCNILVRYRDPDEPDNYLLMDNIAAYYMRYHRPDEASLFKSRLEDIVMLDSVHYVMPEDLEDCDLDRIIKGGAKPNETLLLKLLHKAEKEHDTELLHRLEYMLHQPYGENSIPASTTHLTYANAPSAGNLFQSATINIQSGRDISESKSTSWGLGGTFTVGPGIDPVTTFVSGGSNYNYSRSHGRTTSMFIDLNGDGLTDWVYEKDDRVYFRRQRKTGSVYVFESEKELKGVRRLSHEVTDSHTWGLQLSFGADLSYSNPVSTTYTDTYFSDINADGLPDLIDGDSIYINRLVNGYPVFGVFTGTYNEPVPVNNNQCEKGIIFDGEVDEHIECDLQEILVGSYSLDDFFGSSPDYDYGTEKVKDEKVSYPEMKYIDSDIYVLEEQDKIFKEIDYLTRETPEVPAPKRAKRTKGNADASETGDSLIIRIEGDRVNIYRLEYVCNPVNSDPEIETVRVWVAPHDGDITITDDIALLEDTSLSRLHSKTADGVSYTIQLCGSVTSGDSRHLKADRYTLLHRGAINAEDTASKHWVGKTYVKTGDIIMFRLRSGENNLFDKTHWHHIIKYNESDFYDSERDYLCTGEGHFQAYKDGDVVLTFSGRNDGVLPVNLRVRKTGGKPYTLDTVISRGAVNLAPVCLSVETRDSIFISLGYHGSEPHWGDIHLIPKLLYISDFPLGSSGKQTVHDTVTYYPDIQVTHSSFYPDKESPYRKLFGPLHKGWGEFAYQNIGNADLIILDSLVNTQLLAAEQMDLDSSYVSDTSFMHDDNPDSMLSKVNSVFAENNIYNPISESCYWVPMRADSRTAQWIAYGNLGAVGKTVHSNAREVVIENEVEDIVEYDSPLPFKSGETRKNNFVRKKSRSIQHSISAGAIVVNESLTFGSYSNIVDYMDMNGDGFPDFVGKDGIQYSMPWGGIGTLQKVKNFSPFKSQTTAAGIAFSASTALLEKNPGNNTRDGNFHLCPTMGASRMEGASSTGIQFMDVNADGLPDKINVDENTVNYNLGYRFSVPYPFTGSVCVSEGTNLDISASAGVSSTGFSIAQISISGGINRSVSTSQSQNMLVDINGDGLPDKLICNGNGRTTVVYNHGNNHLGSSPLPLPDTFSSINEGRTSNVSTTLGATGGFSLLLARFNFGLQTSPGSTSASTGNVMLTDMDGDGLVDWVKKEGNQLQVLYNKAGRANLLTAVTNPTGQRIELEYSLSEPSTAHRNRQWNLTRITNIAPAQPMPEAREYTTEAAYTNPFYDNYERTDYGYEYVHTVTNKDKVSRSVYHNRSFLQNGELAENAVMDAGGNIYILRKHGMRYKDIVSGEEHNGDNGCDDANTYVAEDGYWTEYYEKEKDPQIVTRYTIRYDDLHNMVEYTDYGDVSVPEDDWRQEITYLPNTANNMISLPKTETVSDKRGNVLRSTSANYSAYGEPAHINFEDKIHGTVATTHLRYDHFGNILAVIFPEDANGEHNWSAFTYDSETHSYVVETDNPFRVRTRTSYDYRWGVPLQTIDPAGNEIRYTYDYKGRLATVLAPIEAQQGKKYTVRYEYNLVNHNLKSATPYWFTHVYKDMYDSLFVQREVSLYDEYGRKIQKKHFAEVNEKDDWVVDGAEEWDAYGRVIGQGCPFMAQAKPYDYEPIDYAPAVVRNVYDVLDRPIEQTNADGTRRKMHYHFDRDMNGVNRLLTRLTDENGVETATLKSPQDRLIQQTAGDNTSTFFEYSPIGELLRTTDAEGYRTTYSYDMLGRLVCRTHPDEGKTLMHYDLAGNLTGKQTANLDITGDEIKYIYRAGRLTERYYPQHSDNDVHFLYDPAGRIALRQDGTGSEEFVYDHLGNVAQSVRRIVVPTENQAYVFRTLFKYDSFGRIRNIIYPDGEVVHYGYTTGGLLKNVVGLKQGDNSVYLWNRVYDEQGRKIFQLAGNGVWTRYGYDPARQWLKELHTELPNGEVLQDLHYLYDAAGNSTDIEQSAPHTGNGLGGKYDNHYLYDRQYRLVQSDGWGDFTYTFKADYSPSGRLGNKFTKASALTTDLVFGYDFNRQTHQPRTIFDPQVGTLEFFWDANGNLAQMIGCKQNAGRLHEWDEENRLRFVLGEKFAGYYGYDANGERVYKLLGTSSIDQINSGSTKAQAVFDYAVLYPNPYIVVTPKGYTKHYYAGTERLAAVIGSGGLGNMVSLTAPLGSQHDQDIIKPFYTHYQNYDPFYYHGTISQPEKTEDIAGENHPDLDYQCKPTDLVMVDILPKQDILLGSISQNASINGQEKEVYFYHGDHLGSANWITDFTGTPIQYIHYAPYGELVENQHAAGYDERYKFTGKERDVETGYDYFGARFYWATIGHWLSVDPLADKYPNISPYAYCAWNPVKFVDPDGNFVGTAIDIFCVGMDLYSIGKNLAEGNTQAAIVDAGALAIDALAVFVPGVTAGAGIAVKAARAADKGGDAIKTGKQLQKTEHIIPPNGGKAKPHGGQTHNAKIDDFIQGLGDEVSNIRKNQIQVDKNGKKVGSNRPDVQYDKGGVHYNVEFDVNAKNSSKHGDVILHNDPNSKVILNVIEK